MPDSIPYSTVEECKVCSKEFGICEFNLTTQTCLNCMKLKDGSEAEDDS